MKLLFTILLLVVPLFAVTVGETAPPFSIETIDESEFNLEDEDSPVLLIFWATWCPVCKEEVPKLKTIYNDFSDRGLRVLAINVGINDSPNRTKAFIQRHEIDYPVAFDTGSVLTKRYNVIGTPTVMIIDSEGVVKYRSAALPDDLEEHFDSL